MADIQKQVVAFDEAIRLKRFDENKELRAKRDSILNVVRTNFEARRKEDKSAPTFEEFNQGSYQMGTGIQPAEGDYDIDVGLRFNVKKSKYPNPVDLKVLVADALEGHTELGTDIRKSCVTVKYKKNGEQAFHVDLAIYAYDDPETKKKLFVAKGKRGSDENNREWEESDPLGLMKKVEERFADDDDQSQFIRVIRLLKRWKTEKFKIDGNNAPPGIGITMAAVDMFTPTITRDRTANTVSANDVCAMRKFVETMLARFSPARPKEDGTKQYRLVVNLPVAPFKDIFEKMSDGQMTTLRERLLALRDRLSEAEREVDPVVACKLMQREFGDEFPVPEKKDTAEPKRRAVTSSGVSA